MKKRVIIGVISVLVLITGFRICSWISPGRKNDSGRGSRAVAVRAVPIDRRTIIDSSEFTGTLLPNSQFTVAPKVPGKLEKLLVNIGDPVRNGSLIAILDSEEYEQQLVQAGADLDVSRANLIDARNTRDTASREYDRIKSLREQQIASAAELDQAESVYLAAQAKYDVAQVQIKHKEAALRAAEVRLSYTRIQAAWEDGLTPRTIAERFVDEGTMLRANDPIVSIVDLQKVLAVINVVEKDFPKIRIGQIAEITTDAHPGKIFEGHIVRRAPVLDEATRKARVEIEIPNNESLLTAGMFVRAELQFDRHEDAVVVPQSAVVNRDGHRGVFIADPDKSRATFAPVETGISRDDLVEILSPDLSGLVITLGQHLLEDGASILLTSEETSRPSSDPSIAAETSDALK
ncbi:efflux RND transporter periplasmic adaptor subunit [bacterium]|nr:efflux RND transporter periplasmic adaptor subunit [candidate division CSSED10-310 bacterium]